MLLFEELSRRVIGAMIEVHTQLGPGLLESAYEERLAHELTLQQIPFQRQVPLPVVYKGIQLDCGYRLNFVVDEKVVLELKAVETLHAIHNAQLLTYLRLSGFRLGLLVNFNTARLTDTVKRIIN